MHRTAAGALGTTCFASAMCRVTNSECAMHAGRMLCVCLYGFVAVGNRCEGEC